MTSTSAGRSSRTTSGTYVDPPSSESMRIRYIPGVQDSSIASSKLGDHAALDDAGLRIHLRFCLGNAGIGPTAPHLAAAGAAVPPHAEGPGSDRRALGACHDRDRLAAPRAVHRGSRRSPCSSPPRRTGTSSPSCRVARSRRGSRTGRVPQARRTSLPGATPSEATRPRRGQRRIRPRRAGRRRPSCGASRRLAAPAGSVAGGLPGERSADRPPWPRPKMLGREQRSAADLSAQARRGRGASGMTTSRRDGSSRRHRDRCRAERPGRRESPRRRWLERARPGAGGRTRRRGANRRSHRSRVPQRPVQRVLSDGGRIAGDA